MNEHPRTEQQIEFELRLMRQRIAALERLETEREQMLRALRDSEDRYRSLMENFNGIAFRCALDWRPVFFHGAVESMTGYSETDFVEGRVAWADVIHPDDLTLAQQRPPELLSVPGHSHEMDYRIRHRDGSILWVCECVTNVCGPDGQPAWLQGVILNITIRRQAEEALKKSQKDWANTFNAIGDWISLIDAHGKIVRSNRGSEPLLNLPPDQVEGRVCCQLVHGVGNPMTSCPMTRMLQSHKREVGEVQLTGSGRWLTVTVDPVMDDAGRVERAVHIVHDITDRKRAEIETGKLEAQLQQARKMEVVGRLAGGVAHDFNDLLTVILGNAQIATAQLAEPGSDPAKTSTALGHIILAAQQGASLTHQLLTFSRQDTPHPELLDPNAAISEMEDMLACIVRQSIDLQIELAPTVGRVRMDKGLFRQVIMNLSLNARDAMPAGGVLRIETGQRVLDAAWAEQHVDASPGPHVTVSIRDTGQGMDSETLARAFEPFFTTKGPGQGTGLGLATVYGIIRQAGGHITASSTPGLGSTFTVYLPMTVDTPLASTASSVTPPAQGNGTVLICDDNESLRYMLRFTLERAGFRVLEASDGPQALAVVKRSSGPVDLLVTDLTMPQMSGRELAAKLRETHPGLRVMLISGYTAEVLDPDAPEAGSMDFMAKPFQLTNFLDRVHEAMAR